MTASYHRELPAARRATRLASLLSGVGTATWVGLIRAGIERAPPRWRVAPTAFTGTLAFDVKPVAQLDVCAREVKSPSATYGALPCAWAYALSATKGAMTSR